MESLIVEFDQFPSPIAKFLYLDGRYKSKKKVTFCRWQKSNTKNQWKN